LEHSRVYYFENAGQSEYYIGSADWRARNLRKRVEVVAPVLTGAASSYGTSEEGAKDAAPLRRAAGAARQRETAEAAR
jgi:hypothetical protein